MFKAALTSALIFSGLSFAQIGHACSPHPNQQISKLDVAFAGVIFEGTIREVNEREFVFNVGNVIRGDLSDKTIKVGLPFGFAYGPPKSVDDFISKYGNYTRVALTTPKQVETFCQQHEPDAYGRQSRTCDYRLIGLQPPNANKMPYILKNNCGPPYLFSVERYEKSKNYEYNLKIFEQKIAQGEGSGVTGGAHQIFQETVGGAAPLPWRWAFTKSSHENIVVDLYQKDPFILNMDLDSVAVLEQLYLLQGKDQIYLNKLDEEKKFKDEKRLVHYLKQMKIIIEKDPDFAERLLEED